jgi:Ca2+-binding RTX toxin-like protein
VLRLAPGHALDPSEMGETLSGTEGRDQISGEDGDDIIHGGAGPDILIGGAGWDRLHGGHGDDELYGGEFVYAPVGEQTAWVGDLWDGGNVFHGGPGDDTIHAGGGSDIFEVNRGDGWDLITDLRHTDVYGELLQDDPARFDDWLERTIDPYAGVDAHRSQLVNAQDILRFGPGIRPEHILVTRDDRDLVVRYEGPFTGVSFHNWFMSAENQLSRIVFEDGTVWSQADLLERSGLEYHPDVVNRAPVPGAPVAALQVRSGDRTIWDVPETAFRNDDAGDVLWFRLDALPGATRPDWVRETRVTDPQTGGSRYLFELAPTSEDAGTHEFHLIATDRGGLSAAVPFVIDVLAPNRAPRLVATLPDLTAGPIGAGARPLNLGAFTDDDGDPLRFDLRTLSGAPLPHWLDADLLTGTLTFAPASADAGTLELELSATDSHGASSALRFSVRVGAEFSGTSAGDVLLGSPGDDVFAGGPGNDRLSGEAGDDRYRYAPGDGLDTIIDSAGDDGILFSSAVDPSRVVARIAQSPERTVLTVRLTDAYGAELSNQGVDIVLPEPASGHEPFASPVEYVQFGSGVRTSMSDLLARPVTVVVPDGLELYLGNRDDETILAGAGTRRIAGRGGHDVIVAGGEALVASGGPGQDHLIGGDGADRLLGDADHDILSGGSGDDYLSGGYNNDLLLGGHGDDTLVGEHGADFLVGGPGNDRLVNVSVVDSVAFNRGDGADRIEFAAVGLGALSFGGGIQLRDLSMAREGSDLVIRTGGDDSVTFVDWYRTTRVSPLKVIQIIGSPADQIAGSSPMAGARAEWFDLRGLVGAFDAAQARAPTLEPWALADAAAAFHLGGSDERAYANDLAWWYGGLGAPDGTLSIAQAREGLRVDRMIFPKTVNPLSGDGPWVS